MCQTNVCVEPLAQRMLFLMEKASSVLIYYSPGSDFPASHGNENMLTIIKMHG